MYKHKNGITFEKLNSSHLKAMLALKDESWFGTHKIAFLTQEDELEWYESLRKDPNRLFLIGSYQTDTRLSSVPIGVYKITDIDWISRMADSAHDVFAPFRGQGLSHKLLEAGVDFVFEMLNLHRLNTEVLVNNIASRKSVIWAGFVPEGVKLEAIYKCSEYIDSECFGLLRPNWERLERILKMDGVCNLSYTPKDGS